GAGWNTVHLPGWVAHHTPNADPIAPGIVAAPSRRERDLAAWIIDREHVVTQEVHADQAIHVVGLDVLTNYFEAQRRGAHRFDLLKRQRIAFNRTARTDQPRAPDCHVRAVAERVGQCRLDARHRRTGVDEEARAPPAGRTMEHHVDENQTIIVVG